MRREKALRKKHRKRDEKVHDGKRGRKWESTIDYEIDWIPTYSP
jgi:hypothetical protein